MYIITVDIIDGMEIYVRSTLDDALMFAMKKIIEICNVEYIINHLTCNELTLRTLNEALALYTDYQLEKFGTKEVEYFSGLSIWETEVDSESKAKQIAGLYKLGVQWNENGKYNFVEYQNNV